MSDEEEFQLEDELRLCPVCRMSISVWATRCRFCGEEVGRPKREEKKLTMRDLGPSKQASYKQSEEVRKALEDFRKDFAGSAGAGSPYNLTGLDDQVLPSLEADFQTRSAGKQGAPSRPTPTAPKKLVAPRSSNAELFRLAAMVVGLSIGVVLLLYGLSVGVRVVADYFNDDVAVETVPDYNRALDMLSRGENPVLALEESLRALRYHDTSDNRAIANQVRDVLVGEVEGLLREEPWRKSNFDRASALTSRAAAIDSHSRIRELHNRVNQEIAAYKMVLRSIDVNAGSATFILNNPYLDASEETVQEGEYVQGRFLVASMTSREVRLLDSRYETDRGFRRIVCRVLEPISAP